MAARMFDSRDEYRLALADVFDGFSDADLALWLPEPSGSLHLSASAPPAQPRVLAAWKLPTGSIEAGWLVPDEFQAWLEKSAANERPEVEIANDLVPEAADAARELGYSCEILGQLTGYWFEEGAVPEARPVYGPTGGLLLRESAVPGELEALDLVQVGREWRVLSEAAVYTYIHTTGISRGEHWSFVSFDGPMGRQSFEVLSLDLVPFERLESAFGHAATARARDDRDAVRLRLRRT